MAHTYDTERLTIAELEQAEELSGKPIDELFPAGRLTPHGARAVAYLFEHRDDPNFTWDDAGNVEYATVVERMVAPDPTDADDS